MFSNRILARKELSKCKYLRCFLFVNSRNFHDKSNVPEHVFLLKMERYWSKKAANQKGRYQKGRTKKAANLKSLMYYINFNFILPKVNTDYIRLKADVNLICFNLTLCRIWPRFHAYYRCRIETRFHASES